MVSPVNPENTPYNPESNNYQDNYTPALSWDNMISSIYTEAAEGDPSSATQHLNQLISQMKGYSPQTSSIKEAINHLESAKSLLQDGATSSALGQLSEAQNSLLVGIKANFASDLSSIKNLLAEGHVSQALQQLQDLKTEMGEIHPPNSLINGALSCITGSISELYDGAVSGAIEKINDAIGFLNK